MGFLMDAIHLLFGGKCFDKHRESDDKHWLKEDSGGNRPSNPAGWYWLYANWACIKDYQAKITNLCGSTGQRLMDKTKLKRGRYNHFAVTTPDGVLFRKGGFWYC